jgi:two-component system NtrC family sensor kinase
VVKLGLRAKFFLYSNAVIAVTMGLVALLAYVHDRGRAYDMIQHRDRQIAGALATLVTDTLERAEQRPFEAARYSARVERWVQRIAGTGDAVRYAFITSPSGVVTHSSQAQHVGQPLGSQVADSCRACHTRGQAELLGRSSGSADASCVSCHSLGPRARPAAGPEPAGLGGAGGPRLTSDILTRPGGERVLDVRVPLVGSSGRLLGELAIGFSLDPVEQSLQAVPRRLAVVALVMILVNSVLTAFYMEALLRPILALNRMMKRAAGGDLAVRAAPARSDEVGELTVAFNRMMDDLGRARDLETVRQTQLAHTEKMAAVGTLAASVAHEVNNPLGGMLTCLENMRADPGNEEMRSKYLPLIQNGVERIQRTVANLLDFSRPRPLQLEPVSINDTLRRVVDLAAYQLRKGAVETRLALNPDDPRVLADRSQMEQLFLNLVLNALQAMPGGGLLTLHTGASNGQAFAEVRDTGRGVPPEIRDRIFDPFFTTRDPGCGTGLGLAVSDNIVAAHGGRIELTSRAGAGSAFRVWLPRHEAAPGVRA